MTDKNCKTCFNPRHDRENEECHSTLCYAAFEDWLPEDEFEEIDFTPAIEEGFRRSKESLKSPKVQHSSVEKLRKRMQRKLSARPPYPLKRKGCDNCLHLCDSVSAQCVECDNHGNWEVDPEALNREHYKVMNGETHPMVTRTVDRLKKEKRMDTDTTLKRTAPEFLHRSAEIMEERGKTYDSEGGERSMGKCVTAFNAITDRDLTESEGWLLLQLLKDVRQWSRKGYHADSAEDCIAYAALKAESLQVD